MSSGEQQPAFPRAFDAEFAVGPVHGNRAYFGRDVLRGLIAGIDAFIREDQPRWKQFRSVGPVLLGSAMLLTDRELIDKIGELAGASIVISKKPLGAGTLERLREVNERTQGLPAAAFAALGGLALKVDGEPVTVGPYDRIDEDVVPTIRTIGYRGVGQQVPALPIMHAKLALLGHLVWHDEDALGHVADIVYFKPHRLWVSSANFTRASRYSLEFGYWTEDKDLLEGAEHFLTTAMAYSEGLEPDSDGFAPDFAPVEFDEEAIRELLADMEWDEQDGY